MTTHDGGFASCDPVMFWPPEPDLDVRPFRFSAQPGLRPRDPSRGARIERIAFKGTTENLHPSFRKARWIAALAALGVSRVNDVVPSPDARATAQAAQPDGR